MLSLVGFLLVLLLLIEVDPLVCPPVRRERLGTVLKVHCPDAVAFPSLAECKEAVVSKARPRVAAPARNDNPSKLGRTFHSPTYFTPEGHV